MTVRIFINPGHGGKDSGAVNHNLNLKEKDIALRLANALSVNLQKKKLDTRVFQEGGMINNKTTTLNDVPIQANSYKADVFISIHMNAVAPNRAKGVEVLFHGTSQNGKLLANYIQSNLVRDHKFVDRGIKADVRNLLVLKATNMPSCLIECGFIDNDEEAQYVLNHTNELAESMANGVIHYLKDKELWSEPEMVEDTQAGYPQSDNSNGKKQNKPLEKLVIEYGSESNKYNLLINGKLILKDNSYNTIIKYLYKELS